MSPPILYCSDDSLLVLVDLPGSIAQAQTSARRLLSTSPLLEPFETPEPKGRKREQILARTSRLERDRDELVQSIVRQNLQRLRECWSSPQWCSSRWYVPKDEDTVSTNSGHDRRDQARSTTGAPPLILSSSTSVSSVDYLDNIVVHNPYDATVSLEVPGSGNFYIPPKSTFLCSSIADGKPQLDKAIDLFSAPERQITFDLILLDPPWTNRSVRHSQVYLSHEQQDSDAFEQTLSSIDRYLNKDGYVAIWITNKVNVRQQVLHEFSVLHLNLQEEWLWAKVTVAGEPVMPIDGIWRKPYESLLLFARQPTPACTRYRVVAAVPDLHSRKPNLKLMFEKFLPVPYRALEIFARSLTSGWWSWGNEVLKFQHESNWTTQ